MTAATFDICAARLAKHGYDVVPIRPNEKRPAVNDWVNFEYHADDPEQFIGSGVGFLTKNTPAIDVDVRDAGCAVEILELAQRTLGHAPKRIGQAPKFALMFQLHGEPFKKIQTREYRFTNDAPDAKAHKVEILADGQQIVGYGTHPDTRQRYGWNGSGSPIKTPKESLPYLSETAARSFVAECELIFARYGKPVSTLRSASSGHRHIPNEKLFAKDPIQLRDALSHIPNADLGYDEWIDMGHALKGALGDAGRDDFLAWSAQSVKDDPAVTLAKWDSFKPNGIGAGTIIHNAKSKGWTDRQERRPDEFYEGLADGTAKPSGDSERSQAEPTENTWPEPVNIMGDMAAPEFTGDEVPPVLAEFALAFARSTGFDPSLAIASAVSVAAAALTDKIQIVGDSHSKWFQQPRLWILCIGRPGCGKTPVQKEMLAPLWQIQKRLTLEYDETVAQLAKDDKKPPMPRVIVGDATIEALSERLHGNPRGVLVANDEFESWLGSHDVYRSGTASRDRGEWLRLFDGGPTTIERVIRGSQYIENWGASILTATTPTVLKKLSRNLPEDGLIQRFIAVVARRKREPQPGESLDALRLRYTETINRLFDAVPRAHGGCVSLSFDAQEYFQAWMRQNQIAQEAFGALEPALESHLSKYPSFMLRLALTFHACENMQQENVLSRDPAAFTVTLDTMQMAGRFLKRATLHAVALYLDRRSGNDVYELAREVGRAILARGWTVVARRDLIQGVRAFRRASEDMQDSVLRLFVDLAWLRSADGGYSKSTPARYAVNPGLAVKFAAEAERERERRAVVREVIAETVKERREDERG